MPERINYTSRQNESLADDFGWGNLASESESVSWQDELETFGEPSINRTVEVRTDNDSDGSVAIRVDAAHDNINQEAAGRVSEWIKAGDALIPEGRREEWAEHIRELVATDPSGAEERVETVLDLMKQLGDDKIEVADLHDRANSDRITEIARDYKRRLMFDPLAGGNWGGMNSYSINDEGEVVTGEYVHEDLIGEDAGVTPFRAALDDRDRKVMEDLAWYSPQGIRVFREIWPEKVWDEKDTSFVREVESRNAQEYAKAHKEAVENGTLEKIVRERQKRQAEEALAEWNGYSVAQKRAGLLGTIKAHGAQATNEELREATERGSETAEFVEVGLLGDKRMDNDDIEAVIEVLGALNKRDRGLGEAVAILKDYELDANHERLVRDKILLLHPRGVEFYQGSSEGKLTGVENERLIAMAKINEMVEKGVNKRIRERNPAVRRAAEERERRLELTQLEAEKERQARWTKMSPEEKRQMSIENNKIRNMREAAKAQSRIELEQRNLQKSEEVLRAAKRARWSIRGLFANKMTRERLKDDISRAKYSYDTAKNNLAGAREILARAERGEM